MQLYRDDGVVLRTQKLGEADRIITILARKTGRVRAVAKGVRRTKSRFGARLEPFTHVERFAEYDACLCFEAGERGPHGEEGVVVRRKAATTLCVRAHGRAAHSGSQPDQGRNALLALATAAQAVAAHHAPRGPDRLSAVTSRP